MNSSKPKYVFATNNGHKLAEARNVAGEFIDILSLADIGCHDDIPENEDTLSGNALAKARWVADKYGCNCFADDTGLEVDALGGEPGVRSARYAGGDGHDSKANMELLLRNMKEHHDRNARFRTVIALIEGDDVNLFEGCVEGSIADSPVGTDGFGYDPVFIPFGDTRSFAQYTADEKNSISHRGRAMRSLVDYLQSKKSKRTI